MTSYDELGCGLADLLPGPWFGHSILVQRPSKLCLDKRQLADIELSLALFEFTRRTGLTTVNLLVKYAETSSPRDAIFAISSAVGLVLGIFGIALLFLLGRFPGRNQVVVFALGVAPDLKDHRTDATTAPPDCTKLFWSITPLVDDVHLIEYLLRLFRADAMLSPVERRMTGGLATRSTELLSIVYLN